MNEIEELLKDEKVEWKKLGEVCEIKRGKVISKQDIEKNQGEYPVYSSQTLNNGEIGKINTYDFEGEYTTWTTDGAYAGTIFYRNGKFSVTNICGIIKPYNTKLLNIKYLTYWLEIEAKKYVTEGSGNPKLMSNVVEKILIPIPSLETQQKIVNILDKFTNYVTELQSELQSRNKQYEYYRDMLLSEEYIKNEILKNNNIKNYCIGEIIKIKNGKDWKSLGAGNIPVYGSSGEMNVYVDKYSYNKPTVLIPRKGSINNVFYLEKPFWNVDTIFYTEINNKIIIPKYFYYFVENYTLSNISTNSTRPSITQSDLNRIKIGVPPIAIQKKVVEILDKFQKVIDETTGLLPKEIEQRQKQYEFYREKLLTFDENVVTHTHTHTLIISNKYYNILNEACRIVGVSEYGVEYKTLDNICEILDYKRKAVSKNQRIKGQYPYYGANGIQDFVNSYIFDGKYILMGEDGSVITKKNTPVLQWINNDKIWVNNHAHVLGELNFNYNLKYIYYYLSKTNIYNLVKGTPPKITQEAIKTITILIPPIHIQNHIVSILDKFYELTQLSEQGLLKEILLRQKQYEYYREALLSFTM